MFDLVKIDFNDWDAYQPRIVLQTNKLILFAIKKEF